MYTMEAGLDEIDRGILYLLQVDARNLSPNDMAARLPVSEGTVRNRMARLEDAGAIEGYSVRVNYETAGYPLHIDYACRAPLLDRSELARKAIELPEVVEVRELMTGSHNVRATAVASDVSEITDIAEKLTEIGLSVEFEELVGRERVQPFERFGDVVSDEADVSVTDENGDDVDEDRST